MTAYKPGTYIALFIGAHFAHHLLTALVAPLLPFIRSSFELTYTQAGMVVSAFTLTYGIAQLPAGWLADRVGRRYLITVGVAGVGLAGAAAGLTSGYGALIVALIAMGIAGGGYHPSASPLIIASVPPGRAGRALGLHLVGGSASHFVTPLLGGALAGLFGWRGAFLGIAGPVVIFGIIFYVIISGRGEQVWSAPGGPSPQATADRDVPVGVSSKHTAQREYHGVETGRADSGGTPPNGANSPENRANTPPAGRATARPRTIARIAVFLVLTSAVAAAVGSLVAFIPLYLVDAFGISAAVAAAALSVFFATGMVAAPIGGGLSDRIGPVRILIVLAIAVGPLIMLAAAVPSALLFVAVLVVLGIAAFVRMPVSEAYLTADVPEHLRSTVLGVYFFAGMEASGIVTPILGRLIDTRGFAFAFTGLGGALAAVSVVAGAALWTLDRASAGKQSRPGSELRP